MNQIKRIAALTLAAAAAVLTVPSAAAAQTTDTPIVAKIGNFTLSGSPWLPTSLFDVTVSNAGPTAAKGYFSLNLPPSVELRATDLCTDRETGPRYVTWVCGGETLTSGASRVYRLRATSATLEPVFGVRDMGSVAGRTARGAIGRQDTFFINWPDRMPLRLSATAGTTTRGVTSVKVRVTNAGTSAIAGYSLMVMTPKGVKVASPGCSGAGRLGTAGCEVYRHDALPGGVLKAGATDTFRVQVTAAGKPRALRMYLAPTKRYTNRDTSATLTVGGAASAPTAETWRDVPQVAPSASRAAEGGAGGGQADSGAGARTGPHAGVLVGGGGFLAVLCGGLLLLARRRRTT